MNWIALSGVLMFGGALAFAFAFEVAPAFGAWNPYRDEQPVWFWVICAMHLAFLTLSLAAFVGWLR